MRAALALALAPTLVACQTSMQAKIVTVGAGFVALAGGYAEHETHSAGPPVTLITGGVVALISTISLAFLDDHEIPRSGEGDVAWLPARQGRRAELVVALRRGACLGSCPMYTVAAYRDGAIVYVGEANVATEGRALGQLDTAQLAQLELRLSSSPLRDLDDAYLDQSFTDAASVDIWYRPVSGPPRLIEHYLGARGAPEQLVDLEHYLDALLQVRRWVGSPDR